ncbi:MAG: hypothetical protein WA414_18625 [Acidobacteriaceae bacterium]
MVHTPNTVGVILLFVAIFLAAILWATHGHTGHHDPEGKDIQKPEQTS